MDYEPTNRERNREADRNRMRVEGFALKFNRPQTVKLPRRRKGK